MTQVKMPASRKRFAELEIILPNNAPRSTLALWRAILDTRHPRRTHDSRIETVGVVLLVPVLIVIAAVILVALLGYFVMWLSFVGVLFVGTVLADLVYHWRHRAWPLGAPDHRAVNAGAKIHQ